MWRIVLLTIEHCICDIPSENKYTNLFTGKFTGIHRECDRDVPESFLGYGFLFSGFKGKSREVPVSLPRKLEIYRDIAMSSPVFHRCITGEFSISWKIFVLVLLETSHIQFDKKLTPPELLFSVLSAWCFFHTREI